MIGIRLCGPDTVQEIGKGEEDVCVHGGELTYDHVW